MAWKNLTQTSLADALIHEHAAITELDELNQFIDWTEFEVMLQNIHNNPACEKQLARDLLFRRFINLSLSDPVPDHSTIWRFRNHLNQHELLTPLLNKLNHQLNTQGIIIQTGEVSIIDASVIQAKNNRLKKNAKGDNTQDSEAKLHPMERKSRLTALKRI